MNGLNLSYAPLSVESALMVDNIWSDAPYTMHLMWKQGVLHEFVVCYQTKDDWYVLRPFGICQQNNNRGT